jgi:hypothetical protein
VSILIPVIPAVLLALLCLPRRRKDRREPAAASRPQVPAGTRYAVTALPDPGPERQPFGFDSGVTIGDKP